MSRASTMILALLLLNVLLGVLCLVVSRSERKSNALRLWGWRLLTYSVGLFITIPPLIPLALRKIAGNALIAYAPILCTEGLVEHTTFRLNRRWTTLAFFASVLPIVINHIVLGAKYSVLVDFLSPAPIANVLYIIGAIALIQRPPRAAKNAARFLGGMLIFCVLVWTARMAGILFSVGTTNDRDRADLTIALFAIAQLIISVATTLGLLWVEVRRMEAALRQLADTDTLTGIANRRATLARFEEEVARASAGKRPIGLAVFDIDFFKRVNDSHGHLAGDAALRHVAALLESSRRETDFVGRVGGEEFVILFPDQNAEEATAAADRVRETIASSGVVELAGKLTVTVSGGVAAWPADGADWDQLFAVADQRLYAAKRHGRNRVEGPESEMPPAIEVPFGAA